jgi:hypothetical protein
MRDAKILLALKHLKAQSFGMKTKSGSVHLRGLFLLSLGFTLGSVLFTTAFAGPNMFRVVPSAQPQTVQQKKVVYYVMSSASAIPKPIAYFTEAGVPTTISPLIIIGRGPGDQ